MSMLDLKYIPEYVWSLEHGCQNHLGIRVLKNEYVFPQAHPDVVN